MRMAMAQAKGSGDSAQLEPAWNDCIKLRFFNKLNDIGHWSCLTVQLVIEILSQNSPRDSPKPSFPWQSCQRKVCFSTQRDVTNTPRTVPWAWDHIGGLDPLRKTNRKLVLGTPTSLGMNGQILRTQNSSNFMQFHVCKAPQLFRMLAFWFGRSYQNFYNSIKMIYKCQVCSELAEPFVCCFRQESTSLGSLTKPSKVSSTLSMISPLSFASTWAMSGIWNISEHEIQLNKSYLFNILFPKSFK